ncbi:organic hydroperoxide resistance protein [Planococcus lenghuensis]|uniref:Ohr subfamily peroxiredoxin n=1 Tax=Planococcus lenghuensis TaxID=2213202 RepID=A0A1Q2L1X3_9BACL|nr:organic hydroperoxide resistance protein [Planococcus lenghuensis]AQQ54439.1 Ohr subfamily peroxiredoxin [Planococcus lenghuensis]
MAALFTTSVTAEGGRAGHVKSKDGVLDLNLVSPKELGGPGGEGTNPEQLFAAGYSACFDGALNLVIKQQKVKEVEDTSVRAEVHFLKDESDGGYKVGADLYVTVSGVDKEKAQELVEAAHQVCPYSKATRGNIDVNLHVV